MTAPIQAQFGPGQGPDGRTRVVAQFATGGAQFTLIVDPDEADQFADGIAAGIKAAAAVARQANGGLFIPGAGQLVVPMPPAPPVQTPPAPHNGHGG